MNLYDQRASIWHQMEDLVRKGVDKWTRDDVSKHENLEREYLTLTAKIDATERSERDGKPAGPTVVTTFGERGGEMRSAVDVAFLQYLRGGEGALTAEHRNVLAEFRTMSSLVGSQGGYTVPDSVRNEVIASLKAFGGLRSVAEVITTDNGATINLPGNDDTANVGEIIAQNAEVTDQDLAFTNVAIGSHIFSSKAMRVPISLLEDTGVDLEAYIARKLGERIGRKQATEFLNGAGGGTAPVGLIAGRDVALDINTTAAFTYDNLINLTRQVDVAYRALPGTAFLVNDKTTGAMRLLKDSQQRPLWEPSTQASDPDRFAGYPVVIDNGMDDDVVGGQPVAFGNFREGYIIRDVRGVAIARLAELYARFHQVAFIGFLRSDAAPKNVKAYAVIDRTA